MRIPYTAKAPAGPRLFSFVVALGAIVSIVAAAVFVSLEALSAPSVRTLLAQAPAIVFGLMLASLASVVVSVILPERPGKAVLGFGAAGFFVCLAAALVFGVRF